MCLRITDLVFEKLISYLDLVENESSFDLEKRPYLKRLIDFCQFEAKVTCPIYYNLKEKKVTIRSLNQDDRIKILKQIQKKSLYQLFPELKDHSKIKIMNFVLVEFYVLFTFVKKDHSVNFDAEDLTIKLKNWLKYFIKINDGQKITPYLHIFVFHIPEFISVYKHLNLFSCQALEKLNSVTKTHYFRQTNRKNKNNAFLVQLLEKANRMEFFHLKGTVNEIYEKINARIFF